MASWGEQFSTGDQSYSSRRAFADSSYSVCPNCHSKKIQEQRKVAGCRHNGDGYGTDVYTCLDCQWTTSFQYDEASTPYYYELSQQASYSRPSPQPKRLDENEKKSLRMKIKLGMTKDMIEVMMDRLLIVEEDRIAFLKESFPSEV